MTHVDALVVGGNGFLGSSMVDELRRLGRSVRVFDRFSRGEPRFEASGVEVVQGDFDDAEAVQTALNGVATLYHFLSTSTPASTQTQARADLDANVGGSVTLFEAAVDAGVGRIVFASSGGAIYGDASRGEPHRETDRVQPISPYGIGKVAIEHLLHYLERRHGIAWTAMRIANPYGPRQPVGRAQGLIPIMIDQVLAGEPVTVLGDGSMVRDYIAVDDLVAMASPLLNEQGTHSIYNLGSGVGSSVAEVVSAIEAAHGAPIAQRTAPQPPTFVEEVVLDITRYAQEFGAPVCRDLREGVRELYLEREIASSNSAR